MRKLKMELDDLEVESFSTMELVKEEDAGTVFGQLSSFCTNHVATCNDANTCDGGDTCGGVTCNYQSCGACSYYCTDSSPHISDLYVDGGCI